MKRTGFIAIVGRPNVGKSTLLNALLGEKIAIVSNKPQTTRTRITGILTKGEDQFVFIDTPGLTRSINRLGDYMSKAISSTIGSADAAVIVVEAGVRPGKTDLAVIDRIRQAKLPAVLVISKTDKATAEAVGRSIMDYKDMYDFSAVVPLSAEKGRNVDALLSELSKLLSEGEWMFGEDEITDQPERQIAAEIIREKILRTTSEEIPHGTAVVIEDWQEEKGLISIRADIYCERQSHKRIIIGHEGEEIKRIGTYAREDLEKFLGTKVFLDLWVKVRENWRDSDVSLKNFGFGKKDFD